MDIIHKTTKKTQKGAKLSELFIGFRYESTNGTFTVPPGGDGFYYFSTYLLFEGGHYGFFDIQVEGDTLCTARTDEDDSSYVGQAACSAATYVSEGIKLLCYDFTFIVVWSITPSVYSCNC